MRLALHAICPYFAMFPESFVREQVETYSSPGDWVFDPFCGRGTTVLESLLCGRQVAGSDINPVAVCVSRAKAERPTLEAVTERLASLEDLFSRDRPGKVETERKALPPFFRRAFHHATLRELLFLRSELDWRDSVTDGFISALVVGSLHGEMDRSNAYFSNQMPRTICLKPDYSLRYWNQHRLFPRRRHVFDMLRQKAELRLIDLPGDCGTGMVKNSDARRASAVFDNLHGQVKLVVTSPPYLNVTRYEEDQWLRLWFLGGDPRPTYGQVSRDDRHESVESYWRFIAESWRGLAPLLADGARLVLRLGAIGMSQDDLTVGLHTTVKATWPRARPLTAPKRSAIVGRQAKNFLPSSKGCLFEMDYAYAL
ncbi:MAG: DNA methylase [Lentisphaerae bacterium]|nr:DNA methylase [Lentisphaerota bacterium]